ncbi:MAG: lysozyme [Candidatus Hydrothermia bacterium]
MKTSKKGIEIIKKYEGLRLKAYKCPAGILTIGYGHTKNVKQGDTITETQAEILLIYDLIDIENCIKKNVKIPLNQNQFDALVSLCFNIGCGNFLKSTLLKKLNEGKIAEAVKEFLKWNKAGGKELAGLTKRRQEEMELFLK